MTTTTTTTTNDVTDNDPKELLVMHDFILDVSQSDGEMMGWINTFGIDQQYHKHIINAFLYTEHVLRTKYDVFYDYEPNRDIASRVIDFIDNEKIANQLNDVTFYDIVGTALLTQ